MERLRAGGNYVVEFSTDGDKAADAILETLHIINESLNEGITQEELELVRLGNKNGFANIFFKQCQYSSCHWCFICCRLSKIILTIRSIAWIMPR